MITVQKLISRASKRSLVSIRCMSGLKYEAKNEPLLEFLSGSQERKGVEEAIQKYSKVVTDIPIVIGEEEIRNDQPMFQVAPFDHQKKIAKFYYATEKQIQKAIDVSLSARPAWQRTPIEERAQVFLRAADLLADKYRYDIIATTMLGQAKNLIQAEIDAGPELIDFYRFNVQYASKLIQTQPISPDPDITNKLVYRGMEGFWAAVTPFNFTAIGAHLPSAPALMGNVALWKPSDTAMLSNYLAYTVLREAGLPPGVINFVPAVGPVFGDTVTNSPDLAGINFTGSVKTFQHLWQQVAKNLQKYKAFPRMIGECGGKNFHFLHHSADPDYVANKTVQSAFEYGGQKCSACSRMYVPESLWPRVQESLVNIHKQVKLGSALDTDTYVSAVIDDKAYARVKGYIDYAKSSSNMTLVAGGHCDDSKGYFIEPTIFQTSDPEEKLMKEEIFGPVLTVYVYPDNKYKETAELMNTTSPFGLTGAIFSKDKTAMAELRDILYDSTGNLYINDKSTGSVVGQQPFGGSRLSGTNDKAGGPHYLLKFTALQSVKECTSSKASWKYPYMDS